MYLVFILSKKTPLQATNIVIKIKIIALEKKKMIRLYVDYCIMTIKIISLLRK